jgi:hypothetical protein
MALWYAFSMKPWLLSLLLQPLALLLFAFFVMAPTRYAVTRWMPDGKLKRFLLFRYTDYRWDGSKRKRPL